MSLLAHYKCNDDAANTTVADSSGNGHDGTATANTSVLAATGKIGGGFDLNAAYYIVPPDSLSIALGGASGATFMAWVKRDAINAQMGIIYCTIIAGKAKFLLEFLADNTLIVGGRSLSTDDFQSATTSGTYTDTSDWHHVAGVIDLPNSTMLIYYDGVLVKTQTGLTFGANTFAATGSGGHTIGDGETGAIIMNGTLDDVRVYDEVLTLPQIEMLYNDGAGTEALYQFLDFTSTQVGNWPDGATWGNASPGTEGIDFPGASDNATIGHTVTLTAAQAAVNITVAASGIFATANYDVTISGVWDQSSTSGKCLAGSSTITVNGNGAFTADGTLDSTQYNSATLILNGTNTLTYDNLSAGYTNGFGSLTCGQSGNTTTIAGGHLKIGSLTVGSGELTSSNQIYVGTALAFDAQSTLSVTYVAYSGATIPTLANGYDCGIYVQRDGVTQAGNVTLNSDKYLYIHNDGGSGSGTYTWLTAGYDLTVGGLLRIGKGADTGVKTLNATAGAGGTSTITCGGNFLNYGTGTAPSVFTAGDSKVVFSKASGTQTLNSGGSTLHDLEHSGAGTLQLAAELHVTHDFPNPIGLFDNNTHEIHVDSWERSIQRTVQPIIQHLLEV